MSKSKQSQIANIIKQAGPYNKEENIKEIKRLLLEIKASQAKVSFLQSMLKHEAKNEY